MMVLHALYQLSTKEECQLWNTTFKNRSSVAEMHCIAEGIWPWCQVHSYWPSSHDMAKLLPSAFHDVMKDSFCHAILDGCWCRRRYDERIVVKWPLSARYQSKCALSSEHTYSCGIQGRFYVVWLTMKMSVIWMYVMNLWWCMDFYACMLKTHVIKTNHILCVL